MSRARDLRACERHLGVHIRVGRRRTLPVEQRFGHGPAHAGDLDGAGVVPADVADTCRYVVRGAHRREPMHVQCEAPSGEEQILFVPRIALIGIRRGDGRVDGEVPDPLGGQTDGGRVAAIEVDGRERADDRPGTGARAVLRLGGDDRHVGGHGQREGHVVRGGRPVVADVDQRFRGHVDLDVGGGLDRHHGTHQRGVHVHRDAHRHGRGVRSAVPVRDRVRERIQPVEVGLGRVEARPRLAVERAVRRLGHRLDRQGVEVGVRVVGRRVHDRLGVEADRDRIVDGVGPMVGGRPAGDIDRHLRGRGPTLPIGDGVAEHVGPHEVRRRRVRAVQRGAGDGASRPLGERDHRERIAVGVRVVREDVDRHGLADGRLGVIVRRGRVVVAAPAPTAPDRDGLRSRRTHEVVAHALGHDVRAVGRVGVLDARPPGPAPRPRSPTTR